MPDDAVPGSELRAAALIDLDAVAHNVRTILSTTSAELIAVVKANAYGHGAVPVARAVLAAGARQLGVATLTEALELRAAGITAPIICWLWAPHEDPAPAVAAGVQVVIPSVAHLERFLATVPVGSGPVRVHLKGDTGLSRSGTTLDDWPVFCRAVATAERAGRLTVVALMSHLSCADEPGDVAVSEQLAVFDAMLAIARECGLEPAYRHLANSPATLAHPHTHLEQVRCGMALYGLDPLDDGVRRNLRPVMTLRTRVALTKRVPGGRGVSYGLTYRTTGETTLALIPLGYADGIPRSASSRAELQINGRRYRIAGRVAMDQFVVDVGDDPVAIGDEVTLFGPGANGEPTAVDWARACGTIDYEIITRISDRVPRVTVGGPEAAG